ncbi:hypothetical protein GCM10016455_04510 [Aliiroseovarius zhejiangensis]|uniref:Amine oxidase domain-containing protein n=1 Tax=Aliiroseovarius zhejiangensis TaxID=1632025 RepID=A0ABQ3IQA7_9RHOB|nr:acetoacetate decarboxylase family protein [Aliiroseovarius zhejiangensis]GHE87660.1 hypothetical protein GCM10016455_04510 [Aliiroseovarius zhejiangensis]
MVKQKIAVVGGGVGAITADYAITQTPDWDKTFDVTLYQMGWRNGGKGASGRNARFRQRIEERGLHVWAGFYDNAFRNMRRCYEKLVQLGLRKVCDPLGTMDKAFKPLSHLFLAERVPTTSLDDNPWRPWVIDLPGNTKQPGSETRVPGPFQMMLRILEIIIEFMKKGELEDGPHRQLGIALPTGLLADHEAIHRQVSAMPADPTQHAARDTNALLDFIAKAQAAVHAMETAENIQDDAKRRGLFLVDIGLAYMRGVVGSDTFTNGYDVLDQWEFTDRLRLNNASDLALDWVAIRGCYDFVFGFPQGNTDRQGDTGAGTVIQAMSHLIPHEDWPTPGPASISYFCAPAPDGEMLEEFNATVASWMVKDLLDLWPKAKTRGKFDKGLFYESPEAAIYSRVNMYGSERYVLSVANSVYHRLAPSESGFSNLYLAGDWTRCGLNAGCVEGATMSGIACASAITGVDLLNVGAEDIPRENTLLEKAMFQTNSISGTAWPLTPFFARGEMTGVFFFYERPRDEVRAMLPDGIHLGHCPMVRPGYHPVGMSFCRYHNVRGSFIPNVLAMRPYGEATFAIPFTHTDEGRAAPLLYPRRLYVNNSSAILAGKVFYAMPKTKADISVGNTRFAASNADGLAIEFRAQQHRDPVALSGHPAHGAISDLLDMTFVTRNRHGRLFYNAFDLQLDRSYVAPVTGEVSVTDPSPDGFPDTQMAVAPLLDHRGAGLPGAFRIWCSWSMTNPLDSRRVRHAAEARSWVRRND